MNRPFSHSSLSTFEQCPAKYQFYYVDQIEKPQESIEAFLGRRVHESLEYLYQEVSNGSIPLYDRIADFFRNKWKEKWHGDIVFVNRRLSSIDYFTVGESCLATYYRKYRPFREPVVGIEVEILFKLDDNDNFEIKGIIDRLDYIDGGRWEIHDYKTSNRPMTQANADRDRQLALYQIGLEKKYTNVSEVNLVWHFLRSSITVRSKRSRDKLSELGSTVRRLVKEILDRVENHDPFPPKESSLCNWCYYWVECPTKMGNNPFVKPIRTD